MARAAEDAGLDGVFVFDHLWPMGRPDRPALACFPLLAAIAATTTSLVVGPLVARVGLHDDDRIVDSMETTSHIAGQGRVVVGLGCGDGVSAAENLAYGLSYPPAVERVRALGRVVERVHEIGLPVWVGGRSAAVRQVAAEHTASLNIWAAGPSDTHAEAEDVRARAGHALPVTWGGQVLIGADARDAAARLETHGSRPGLVHGTVEEVAATVRELHLAAGGLSWVVVAPLDVVADPSAAVENVAAVGKALQVA